jgi:hypothetical protein
MKTKTLTLIGLMALGIFTLTQCESDDAVLGNKGTTDSKLLVNTSKGEAGMNYVVDDNYLVRNGEKISADDIQKLLDLDLKYADLTKGRAFLHYIVDTQRIRHFIDYQRIINFQRILDFQNLDRISRFQRINVIHRGCFENAQIDWKEFGDLKSQLDGILDKYSPTLINENVSITDNVIATKAIKINDRHINQFDKMSIYGIDDADICGDYMGRNRFTRVLQTTNRVVANPELTIRLEKVISQYPR